ncbi:MAG: hypothetical protein ABIK28_19395 [Planctomycetota bacterium]
MKIKYKFLLASTAVVLLVAIPWFIIQTHSAQIRKNINALTAKSFVEMKASAEIAYCAQRIKYGFREIALHRKDRSVEELSETENSLQVSINELKKYIRKWETTARHAQRQDEMHPCRMR